MVQIKFCSTCKKEKSIDKFNKDRSSKDGFDHRCRICARVHAKEHYQRHSDKIKECSRRYYQQHSDERKKYAKKSHQQRTSEKKEYDRNYILKKNYGVTLKRYDEMFEKQNGNCCICGLPQLMKRLAVDHNHKTGEIRSLLCHKCNLLVGHVENNSELIDKILEYLKCHVKSNQKNIYITWIEAA